MSKAPPTGRSSFLFLVVQWIFAPGSAAHSDGEKGALTAKKGHDRVLAGQVRAAAVPSIFSVTPSRGARQLGASPKSRRNKSCRPRTQNAQQSISATVSVALGQACPTM
jgi:hypothetical protein